MARIAAGQRGLVTRSQLVAVGLTRSAISRRVARGHLHRLHRTVYAVGHTALPPFAVELAALLAAGPGALLSHGSAAVVWGLLAAAPGPVHVTCPGSHRRTVRGITIHATALEPGDRRRHHDLAVTAPARTLLDLAHQAPDVLPRALNEALVQRLVRPAELDAVLRHGRPGTTRLRTALDDGPTPTRSTAERRLLTLLGRGDLPRPRTNDHVLGHEVDAHWPEARVVLEFDSFAFHAPRAAFERDRLRDARLTAAGYAVVRVTWRQVTERPEAVAARLAAVLARRS